MARTRYLISIVWLALALVFGQQAVAMHDIAQGGQSHWQKHDGKRGTIQCDENFACASFSGAIGPTVPVLPVVTPDNAVPLAVLAFAAPAAIRLAFRSRAPPTLL